MTPGGGNLAAESTWTFLAYYNHVRWATNLGVQRASLTAGFPGVYVRQSHATRDQCPGIDNLAIKQVNSNEKEVN
jgi:hypothetical protein